MEDEIWKPVVGYEGMYEVSSLGRVKSLPRTNEYGRRVNGRFMSIILHPSGHTHVKLSIRGNSKHVSVHRLVLFAFDGPPPKGHEGCHNDGNPSNNHRSNLRWDTRSANQYDRVKHGTHHMANRTHCPQNHPYDAENTYRTSDGRRMCIKCIRNQWVKKKALKEKTHGSR